MRFDWLYNESGRIAELFIWHLSLSVIPVLIGLLLALPLGWFAQRAGVFRSTLLGAAGLLYTIPSLALFVLLPLVLGTRILDPLNVVVALTVYALALLVRTVSDGLDSISPDVLQAANAMGYRRAARLLTVELPLAVPVIAAGLRVAVVSNVSIVSVAALVGTPQLGLLFTQGLQLQFLTPIIAGIVLCVLLAVLLDGLVLFIAHRLTPWQPGRMPR
ncbi:MULTISPECIES: ABC transporter permease [Rhizobium/Agrobacterium group]|uniref:ABC transporter membrane spanning protein (Proline/glycine/betaine) n=2 Tax=Rhizobium/Agrobacterium group TaxID=227290 RepID=B9JQT8_ALLAM|nr:MULTISPECIES: ABC transporter permease subunit [Rhizobium/Agrobacterium group]ACM35351.1 ABC transporter membrane spanning protein (proline/glycine/betaine) [Allorhizobium ampelinum S4]MCF1447090.1 ABC transporter permease subunit [Allorhizobium ampelinum]MCF1493521.1 ABC transporter permease subunit [Allorhizobium ampelinum]MUO28139.1 ABC transporter permease subunit [Agrobacterium vitis]MUO40826.1 ABC transporter permease subunit [Agrobacterium vitis]